MTLYQKVLTVVGMLLNAISTKAAKSELAPDFNEYAPYSIGDLVIKDGVLQRCTAAGTGTAAIFSQTTLNDVSEALKADIPTKTSELTNNGSDGVHPFLTEHQSLANYKTKAEMDVGWWSDWKVLRNNVDVTSQVIVQPIFVEDAGWSVESSVIAEDSSDVHFVGNEDSVSLSWTANDGSVSYIATRCRVSAPIPAKTSELTNDGDGQHPFLTDKAYTFTSPTLSSSGATRTCLLAPFANNQLDMTDSSLTGVTELAIEVDAAPIQNTMRDLWFVVTSGNSAPLITWPTGTYPAGSDFTNLDAVDNVDTVFLVSEYSPGKFIVARQIIDTSTSSSSSSSPL